MKAACKQSLSKIIADQAFEYNDRITRCTVRRQARRILNQHGYENARLKCDRENNIRVKRLTLILQVWIDGKEYKFELKVMI